MFRRLGEIWNAWLDWRYGTVRTYRIEMEGVRDRHKGYWL
jgi:hypothetical protein